MIILLYQQEVINMNKVIKILMDRDGETYEGAKELVNECREAIINESSYGYDVDEIIGEYLGLEPDYLFDILYM